MVHFVAMDGSVSSATLRPNESSFGQIASMIMPDNEACKTTTASISIEASQYENA